MCDLLLGLLLVPSALLPTREQNPESLSRGRTSHTLAVKSPGPPVMLRGLRKWFVLISPVSFAQPV